MALEKTTFLSSVSLLMNQICSFSLLMEFGRTPMAAEEGSYPRNWQVGSPEIVEVGEESMSTDGGFNDVYVAVGKNDLHVVKWALDHAVSPGKNRVFLVHVFHPITYIPTPVGRLSKSQLSKEQVQVYVNEESNRRMNLLEKYIRLCNDTKVAVETMLVESNAAAKAILDLIHVVNITNLVMGTKQSPFTRLSRRGQGKGEYVHKHAPEFCKISLVYDGKMNKGVKMHKSKDIVQSNISSSKRPEINSHSKRNFFECICFPSKFT